MEWMLVIAVIFIGVILYGHKRAMEDLSNRVEELEEKVFPETTDDEEI